MITEIKGSGRTLEANMKNYFNTREEAEEYRQKKELYIRVPEYLPCFGKWALVFPIKATTKGEFE